MTKDKSDQGIVLDEKSQEQPKDKDRAQTAHKTDRTQQKDDELQPLREKSGFYPSTSIEIISVLYAFDAVSDVRISAVPSWTFSVF